MGITVNDVEITDHMIEQALPEFRDAPHPVKAATHALVMRELLLQQADKEDIHSDNPDEKINAILAKHVEVPQATAEDCKQFYDANQASFVMGEQAQASHILFSASDDVQAAALHAQAQGVLDTLKTDCARFAELAQAHSSCPSAAQGGDLGQFGRGQMVPEFEQAVFNTPANSLVDALVKTQFGWHIIHVGSKVGGSPAPFEAAQPRIAEYLQQATFHRAIHQYLQTLVAQARIEGVVLEADDSAQLA